MKIPEMAWITQTIHSRSQVFIAIILYLLFTQLDIAMPEFGASVTGSVGLLREGAL